MVPIQFSVNYTSGTYASQLFSSFLVYFLVMGSTVVFFLLVPPMSFRIAKIIFLRWRMANGKLQCIYISLHTKSAYHHLAHSPFTHRDHHLRCHLLIRTGNCSHIHSHNNGNVSEVRFLTQGYFETLTGQGSKIRQSVDDHASGLTKSQPPWSTGKILF